MDAHDRTPAPTQPTEPPPRGRRAFGPRRGLAASNRLLGVAGVVGVAAIALEVWGAWHHPATSFWTIASPGLSIAAIVLVTIVSIAWARSTRRWVDARHAELQAFTSIVERSPIIVARWRVDDPARPTPEYISPNMRALGYTAEDFFSGAVGFHDLAHPDDRAAVMQKAIDAQRTGAPTARAQFRVLTPEGRTRWVEGELVFERDPDAGVVHSQAWLMDVTDSREAALARDYRDRVLHGAALAITELATSATSHVGLPKSLRIIGEALGVGRVVILSDCPTEYPYVALQAEWHGPGSVVRMTDAVMKATPPLDHTMIDAWRAPLREGKPVVAHRATANPAVRAIMERNGALSILTVPIFAGGVFWGNIGIDDCTIDREWTTVEIDMLGALAEVIGALVQRESIQASLGRSEARFRSVSEAAQDAIIIIDRAGRVTYWNQAAERIFGYTARDAEGRDVHAWLAGVRYRERAAEGLRRFAATGEGDLLGHTVELSALRSDGTEIPVEVSLARLEVGDERSAVAIVRDISERKRAEAQILEMARVDALTGLANRRVFAEAVEQARLRAKRAETSFAVLYLDLDHFKEVNDTFGHQVGDALLRDAGDRLRGAVRETDTVARLGGDEFAILVSDAQSPAEAGIVAAKIVRLMNAPYTIEGTELRIGASVGVAMHGADAPNTDALLAKADLALYRAKAEGRGTYRFFTDAMNVEVRDRVAAAARLAAALRTEQLTLHFEPRIALADHRLTAVEALVCWPGEACSASAAHDIVLLAEQSGLAIPLARWLIRAVCREAAQWFAAGRAPNAIAIDMHGLQLAGQTDLAETLEAALAEVDIPPTLIEIDVSERTLTLAAQEHSDALTRLRATGVQLAVDEFGQGFSSLESLREYHVDRLKVARRFIVDARTNADHAAIVKAALAVGRELGVTVVLNGVDDAATASLVAEWGALEAQGAYLARPLDAASVLRMLTPRVPASV